MRASNVMPLWRSASTPSGAKFLGPDIATDEGGVDWLAFLCLLIARVCRRPGCRL